MYKYALCIFWQIVGTAVGEIFNVTWSLLLQILLHAVLFNETRDFTLQNKTNEKIKRC
jgi:hypothetical protein